MGQNKNSAKIYTASSQGKLNVSFNDTKQIINVTNNKAKSYEEFAAKYRDEAKKYRDEAQEFAEQNSNVTMEDIYQVQNLLESKINTKQPVGDYALVSQIPENVSDLNNDSQYATVTQLANLLPSQSASDGKFLKTDGEGLEWANISAFSLFDTKLSDHILEGEEGLGWALQGTYTLSSYTDFYQKCLAEKNAGVATQTTLGASTITTYNNANGHIFYDISDKAVVDTYYEKTGSAWFYGIDTENERIFLPRNKWVGIKGVSSTAPVKGNGSLGIITNNLAGSLASQGDYHSIAVWNNTWNVNPATTLAPARGVSVVPWSNSGAGVVGVTTDSTKSGIIADTSEVLQIDTEKYLYICVGNTMVNEADVDVANLTTDVQNLEASKVDLDAQNLSNAGKSLISGLGMPSEKYIDLTLGASGSTYTAPANGWVYSNLASNTDNSVSGISNKTKGYKTAIRKSAGYALGLILPVANGDVFSIDYDGTATNYGLRFYYSKGSKEVV